MGIVVRRVLFQGWGCPLVDNATGTPATRGAVSPRSENMTARSQLLTIDEAAERLNVSVRFVRRLVAERRVPYLKIGKFVRFDQDDLDSWIAAQRVGQSQPFVVRISGVP